MKTADSRCGQARTAVCLRAALLLAITTPAPCLAQTACPDAATVSAARLIELEAMMMNVGLRCARVGVPMADHLDDMAARHQTMFQNARGRLRTFMAGLVPVTSALSVPTAKPAPAAPLRGLAKKGPPAAKTTVASAPGKNGLRSAPPAAAGASARKVTLAAPAAAARTVAGKASRVAQAVTASAAAKAPQAAPKARHGDPMDRYMTMLGNRYGAGSTTPGRCQSFEAIALSLGETGSESRLLTMVAESLIGVTLIETLTACPAKS